MEIKKQYKALYYTLSTLAQRYTAKRVKEIKTAEGEGEPADIAAIFNIVWAKSARARRIDGVCNYNIAACNGWQTPSPLHPLDQLITIGRTGAFLITLRLSTIFFCSLCVKKTRFQKYNKFSESFFFVFCL